MSTPHTLSRSAAASTARALLFLLLLSCHHIAGILGKSQLCEVETGQTNIILDIEESRGDFIGQQTTPPELQIYGDLYTEIALDLVFPKGNPTFQLEGKNLQLLKPLDRDEENLSHNIFQSTPVGTTIFRRIQALDKDAGVNGLVEYFIVEGSTNATEDETMTIADGLQFPFPIKGR